VRQVLQLAQLELEVAKTISKNLQEERSKLRDDCRNEEEMMDSFYGNLVMLTTELNALVASEQQRELASPITELVPETVIPNSVSPPTSTPITLPQCSAPVTANVQQLQTLVSCDLPSNYIMVKQMKKECLQDLHLQHEARFRNCQARLESRKLEMKDTDRQVVVAENHYAALQGQYLLLNTRQPGLSIFPHPMVYVLDAPSAWPPYMKITNCALCKWPFPFNDMVIGHCFYMYHPWCALEHFQATSTCAESWALGMPPIHKD
jgi:hypothetical protein